MKKLVVGVLCLSAVLVGCGKEELTDTSRSGLSKEDQAVTWEASREKSFGKYDYLGLSVAETKKTLEEKFQVDVSPFFEEASQVVEEQLGLEDEAAGCDLIAADERLTVQRVFLKESEDKQSSVYGKVVLTYEWSSKTKRARLKYQEASLEQSGAEGVKDGKQALEGLAKAAGVTKVEEKAEAFDEAYTKLSDAGTEGEVVFEDTIAQSKTDGTIGRLFSMSLGKTGTLTELTAFINDNRK